MRSRLHLRGFYALCALVLIFAAEGCRKAKTQSNFCLRDRECTTAGNICLQGRCAEAPPPGVEGAVCSERLPCATELSCANGFCKTLAPVRGSVCELQADCGSTLLCTGGFCEEPPPPTVCQCAASPTDRDGDCLNDTIEDTNGNGVFDAGDFTDLGAADTDADGVFDGCEDANRNGVVDLFPPEPDPRTADSDGDGLSDGVEDANKNGAYEPDETDATAPDTDADGYDDGIEDRNRDGLWNCPEDLAGPPCETNPRAYDTDRDGLGDRLELAAEAKMFVWLDPGPGESPDFANATCGGANAIRFLGADGIAATPDDQTCPWQADSDADGIVDGKEDRNADGLVSTGESNPRLSDSDNDGLADGVEDANQDGLVDRVNETDPGRVDSDGDGLGDGVEDSGGCLTVNNVCSGNPAGGDTPCDCAAWRNGRFDARESDPRQADSDLDGLRDGVEDQNGDGVCQRPRPQDVPRASDETCTYLPDSDGDGLNEGAEDLNGNGQIEFGETDARRADPDNDCATDTYEVFVQTDPFSPDTDEDGLPDGLETLRLRYDAGSRTCVAVVCDGGRVAYQNDTCTNPRIRDSDGDGLVDGFENLNGFTTGEDVDADGCRLAPNESNPCFADANQPPATDGSPVCSLDFSVTSCPKTPVNSCSACSAAACPGDPECLVGPCTPGSPCERARKESQALICAEGNIKPVVLVRSIENDYTVALPGIAGPFGAPDSLYDFQTLYFSGVPIGSVFQSLDGRSNVEPQPIRSVFGSVLRLGTLDLGTPCDTVTDDPPIIDNLLPAPPSGACVPDQNYVIGSSSFAPSDVAERSFLRVNQELQALGYQVARVAGGNLRAHDDESLSGVSSAARIDYAVDRYTIRKTGGGAVDAYQVKRKVISTLLGGNAFEDDLPAPAGYHQGSVGDLRIQFYRRFVQKRSFLADGSSQFKAIAQYGAVFALTTVDRDCANEVDKLACKADVERYSLPVDDLTNGSGLARYQAQVGRTCDAYDPAPSKADFLVVVDDSGSMQNFIRAIQQATRDVGARLNANNENMDWRIAMTTSNMGRSSNGTPLPHPGLADQYIPFDGTYAKLEPAQTTPGSTLFEYQTTAYGSNGTVQRCKYKDSFTNDPLESPYCCSYTGNSTEDYLVGCCSIGAAVPMPAFYNDLQSDNLPNFNFADTSTTLGGALTGNDTLRCYDFPRVGDEHEMLPGFTFYPSGVATAPTGAQRQRHLLDYLCGEGDGADQTRPAWGTKGQLWPPGFQGFNGDTESGSYKRCTDSAECTSGSSCVDNFCVNPRRNGANLLIRNADMLVTQMNRDCGQTSSNGTRSPRVRAGSAQEHPLQAAKRAAERATSNGRGTGAYQLRPDAPLITILLSDEEDYSNKYRNNDRSNPNPALDRSSRDHNQLPAARCLFNGDQGCSVDYCQNTCFGSLTDQGAANRNIPSARRFEAGVVKRTEANRNSYCVAPVGAGEPARVCSETDPDCAAIEPRWNGLHLINDTVDENLASSVLNLNAPTPDPSQATGSNVPSRDVLNIAESASTPTCEASCGSDCLPCARYLRERQYIDFFNGQCSPPDGTTPVAGDIRRFERPAIDLGGNVSLVMPVGFVYAITRTPGRGGGSASACGSSYEGGDGTAYRDVALASGGRVADICAAETTGFADFLDQVIVDAQGIGSPYRLSGNPISSTIRVGVLAKDGTFRLLKRSSVSGFDYNPQTRSVAFFSRDANDSFNQVVPTRDARVFVSYRVWEQKCALDCALGDVCAVCTCSATNPECCTDEPTFQCRTPTPCVAGCGPCQQCDPNTNKCADVDPCGGTCTAGTPFCVAQPNNTFSCQACPAGTTPIAIPCDDGEGGVCPGQPKFVCVSQGGLPNNGTTCAVTTGTPEQDCCGAEKLCSAGQVCVLEACPGESCRPTAHCKTPNGNSTPTDDFCGNACGPGTICAPVPCVSESGACPPLFTCIANNPGGSATCEVGDQCSCPGNVCADCPVGQRCSLTNKCEPICPANISITECCSAPGANCCPSGEQFDPATLTCRQGQGCPVACGTDEFCDPIAGVCRKLGG